MTAHFSTEQPARGSNQVRAQFELSLLGQVGEFGLFVERVTGPINLTNNVQAHTDTLHAGEPQMGDYDFCEYLIRPLL